MFKLIFFGKKKPQSPYINVVIITVCVKYSMPFFPLKRSFFFVQSKLQFQWLSNVIILNVQVFGIIFFLWLYTTRRKLSAAPILKLIWTMSWFISPLPGNLVKIIFQLWPCICWKVLFGLSDMLSVQFISQP